MNSHSIVPLAAKAKPACRKCPLPGHDRAAVRYYCKTCRSPGCATCVAEKHANHLVVQLADVARDLVSALTENATRILEAKNRLKELVACNQSTRHRVESTGRAFEEQLRSHFDAARRALEWTQYHTQRKATADTLSKSTRTLLRRLDVVNYNALRNRHKMSKIRTGDLAAAADECVGAFQGRPAFTGLQQGRHGESRRIRLEFDDEEPPYPALYNAGEVAGLFEALRVPRGAGFCFNVPRPETTTSASKAFQLKLDLRTEVISPARTSLTFSAPPQDGAITVTPSADGTIIAFGKLMDWASIRANEVFRSGMHTWTLRLFTYNVMIGVTSEDEHRMDLHKGRGFFWYIDIAGPSFGSLGSSTAALEGIPPLPTLPQPVDVLLTYNAEEATLSAKVAGSDKGVIGTGIAPPVQPAFCFVADSQMITVL
ncbi:conserved zinc-finger protein [Diplonema papillatum]|nr:conserved zinc-finger protein [Diplonema papillatum]